MQVDLGVDRDLQRIADIAQNHATKVSRRIGAFLEWSGRAGASPVLDGVVAGA